MLFNVLSPAEQVASHLRDEILNRRWKEYMPGVAHLHSKLGVNQVTINAALYLLEQEGLLESQGLRRRRRIVVDQQCHHKSTTRICILPYQGDPTEVTYNFAILNELYHAGFEARVIRKSLHDLGMNPARVAKYVRGVEADAWIVSSASPEVLTWFAEQPAPAIALFGASSKVEIAGAGVRKSPVMSQLVRDLVKLGHRRIVMLAPYERLQPEPWLYERNFLTTLEECGIATGRYHLPVWKPSRDGLLQCIDNLFQHTPPTALLVDESKHYIAIQQHLASKGIGIPRDVSMICSEADPAFAWCKQPVTHMRWDPKKIVSRIVRWAKNVSAGKEDHRKKFFDADIGEGNTIGPPPR